MEAPKHFCFNKSKVKAFVLGADPTNYSDKGEPARLHYAFGIGQDARYFRSFLESLLLLGLHLEDLYIQNLVPEYQEEETSANREYQEIASKNAKAIASEFNRIDPAKKLPVFITAEPIYKSLLVKGEKAVKPQSLYQLKSEVPIPANKNLLGRPLIPLFRHQDYAYSKWNNYVKHIKTWLAYIETKS